MKKPRVSSLFLLVLLVLLFSTQSAQTMDSPSYRLDWFTPLTTNGGGASASASYAVNLTVGQSVLGASQSAGYSAGLGYWYGIRDLFRVLLPVILKTFG